MPAARREANRRRNTSCQAAYSPHSTWPAPHAPAPGRLPRRQPARPPARPDAPRPPAHLRLVLVQRALHQAVDGLAVQLFNLLPDGRLLRLLQGPQPAQPSRWCTVAGGNTPCGSPELHFDAHAGKAPSPISRLAGRPTARQQAAWPGTSHPLRCTPTGLQPSRAAAAAAAQSRTLRRRGSSEESTNSVWARRSTMYPTRWPCTQSLALHAGLRGRQAARQLLHRLVCISARA